MTKDRFILQTITTCANKGYIYVQTIDLHYKQSKHVQTKDRFTLQTIDLHYKQSQHMQTRDRFTLQTITTNANKAKG